MPWGCYSFRNLNVSRSNAALRSTSWCHPGNVESDVIFPDFHAATTAMIGRSCFMCKKSEGCALKQTRFWEPWTLEYITRSRQSTDPQSVHTFAGPLVAFRLADEVLGSDMDTCSGLGRRVVTIFRCHNMSVVAHSFEAVMT